MSAASSLLCCSAFCLSSGMLTLPSLSVLTVTMRMPAITALAGFVPWADRGMMHTLRCLSPRELQQSEGEREREVREKRGRRTGRRAGRGGHDRCEERGANVGRQQGECVPSGLAASHGPHKPMHKKTHEVRRRQRCKSSSWPELLAMRFGAEGHTGTQHSRCNQLKRVSLPATAATTTASALVAQRQRDSGSSHLLTGGSRGWP